jgi:maltose O-acetyltransferase
MMGCELFPWRRFRYRFRNCAVTTSTLVTGVGTIGDYCQFGTGVQILTPLHPLEATLRRKEEYGAPIVIGSDVWVGSGALILPGVTVGSRTVIGAGSVVTRDLPDDVLAVGNPCRVLRSIGNGD